MKIKAIIFDLDGVVVDSEDIHKKAADIVLNRRSIVIKDEETKEIDEYARGRRVVEILAYFKERFQLKDDINELLKELKETLFQLIDEIHFMDGFSEFIRKIKSHYKTALVTSGKKPYIEKLENKLSISDYFDCMVTGEETENGKPNPDPYVLACKKLHIKPKEAVVIEDTPNGIISAKAAGCACIAITSTFPKEELKKADYIVDDFKETEKIIEVLQ